MNMNKNEKKEMLQKLDEKTLTKRFLIPLYESEKMGCKSVRYTHRVLEFGKDIIYCKDDEYGKCIFTAVQVKRIKISTHETDTIQRQIFEAFGEPFTDIRDGKKKEIDRMVILTSNEIKEEAKDSLYASLRGARLDKLVNFIDGNTLVGLLEKYLPKALWNEYDYFNKYFASMKKEFENIKEISAIGQKELIPLEDLYVSLRVCEKIEGQALRIKEDRKIFEEKMKRGDIERLEKKEKIIDVERAFKEHERLVITGDPGSGKTTLLRYLALKLCRENIEKGEKIRVPIPITLRLFSESGKDLRGYIDEVFEKFDFPRAKDFVEKDLNEGKCVLLLDGFDELATSKNQNKVAEHIHEFVKKYSKARIISTSRTSGYHDELKGFTKLELMEFDDKQIEKFINNWFGKTNPGKAKSMFEAIRKNEQIKAIARNPLMIAIIAIIYEEDQELPQKRTELYERCVDVLLSKWDVQKRLRNVYPSEKKEFILKKLAFQGHSKNKRIMTEKEIMEEIVKYSPQLNLKKSDAKPFLDEIWQRSYLLRQVSRESYDFLHLSFQEYFTALELKEKQNGISIIIRHLLEPWWVEPIILYAGITKDASPIIRKIQKAVPEDIFYNNLMLFVKCVAVAEFTEKSLKKEITCKLLELYKNAKFASIKEKAIQILSLIKPENIINSLIDDLASKDIFVRANAAEKLGRIGSEKSIDPLLIALTKDNDKSVQGIAAYALGKIGSKKALDQLLNTLKKDENRDVRGNAVWALGMIGSENALDPLLIALAKDKDSDVRGSAAYALGMIGSEKALDPLLFAFKKDKDSSVRSSAAIALGTIGNKKALDPLLFALTKDNDNHVRGYAAQALGMIESEKALDPLLIALAKDRDSDVRGNAAEALGRIGSEKALNSLLSALAKDKDSSVRWSAAQALGEIGSEKALDPLLISLAKDNDSSVRVSAAEALGEIGSEKAIDPLLIAFTKDKDSSVRWSAAKALGTIGSGKAINDLTNALKDKGGWPGSRVKDAAFESLEKICMKNKIRIPLKNRSHRVPKKR